MITIQDHVVDFGKPKLTTIDMEDLRIHTTNICRYNGALQWTLAQHSALCGLLVSKFCDDPKHAKIQAGYAAGHDLHESYVGDMVAGLKKYVPGFREIESKWEQHVHNSIGLPWENRDHELVKMVDQRALVLEMGMLGHPAYETVLKWYGGPMTPDEQSCFNLIQAFKPGQAWPLVEHFIDQAKEALNE